MTSVETMLKIGLSIVIRGILLIQTDSIQIDMYLNDNPLPYHNENRYHTLGWGRRGIHSTLRC